ncbi:MAG: hypothetical protein ABI779_26840 [Acidobacteriota bacterium]
MIILPMDLTSEEIRVLQEFRRLNAETLGLETIKALKHPTGAVGEAPAVSLAGKGWLEAGDGGQFSLRQRARDFLAIDAKPMFEEPAPPGKMVAAAEVGTAEEAS